MISIAIVLYASGQEDFVTDDIGNAFEKSNAVAEYADERLAAVANETDLPPTPAILANQEHLQFALVMTLVSQVFLVALVILVARQGVRGFIRAVKLDEVHPGRMWIVCGCVVGAYIGVFLYSVAAAATGISWLEPNSTVPPGVTRDSTTMTITGIVTVIGAPLSEELFFRGLIFSGLLRWGFLPAAVASAFLFSLVHFDPGSFIPFVGIAVLICWIYWRRGSLWDAILFHCLFNGTSFAIMLAVS